MNLRTLTPMDAIDFSHVSDLPVEPSAKGDASRLPRVDRYSRGRAQTPAVVDPLARADVYGQRLQRERRGVDARASPAAQAEARHAADALAFGQWGSLDAPVYVYLVRCTKDLRGVFERGDVLYVGQTSTNGRFTEHVKRFANLGFDVTIELAAVLARDVDAAERALMRCLATPFNRRDMGEPTDEDRAMFERILSRVPLGS